MGVNDKNIAFARANTAAVLVGLFIAFANELRPNRAMFTVFVVAKPTGLADNLLKNG